MKIINHIKNVGSKDGDGGGGYRVYLLGPRDSSGGGQLLGCFSGPNDSTGGAGIRED